MKEDAIAVGKLISANKDLASSSLAFLSLFVYIGKASKTLLLSKIVLKLATSCPSMSHLTKCVLFASVLSMYSLIYLGHLCGREDGLL